MDYNENWEQSDDSEWEPNESDFEPDTPAPPRKRRTRTSQGQSSSDTPSDELAPLASLEEVQALKVKQLKSHLKSHGAKVGGRKVTAACTCACYACGVRA